MERGCFISYQAGGGSTPYDATLLAASGAGAHSSAASQAKSEHLVKVGATAGGADAERLSFTGGNEFVLQHGGPSGKVSLTLSAIGSDGRPTAVVLPKVSLPRGGGLSVAPLRWGALDSAPIRVRTKIGRRTITRLVRGRPMGRSFATVRAAKLHAGKEDGVVDLSLRLRHPPVGAWISPAVQVLRGGHTVARSAPAQLLDRELGAGKAHLKLSRSVPGGPYILRVRLLEATTDGPIQGSTVVTKTLKVAAKG
jgi:hypothetical protein